MRGQTRYVHSNSILLGSLRVVWFAFAAGYCAYMFLMCDSWSSSIVLTLDWMPEAVPISQFSHSIPDFISHHLSNTSAILNATTNKHTTTNQAVSKSHTVSIGNFGKFEAVTSPARMYNNPITKTPVWKEETRRVKFRPFNNFKECVNKKSG